MENKRGNGIFLGIVSVATLIVAIIGATFAYFSASTESNEGAIGATAYEYNLTLSVSPIYPEGIAPALIPLNPNGAVNVEEGATGPTNTTNLLYAINEATNKCVDDNGLQVCALYQVKIENKAVNEVVLTGKLITNTNDAADSEDGTRTGFKNLTYQALTGSHSDNSLRLSGSPKTIAEEVKGEIDIADIVVPGATVENGETTTGKGYSYVLIYLNDNEDQSSEMGATFEGQVKYTSGDDDENGLTGSFTIAAPKPDPTPAPGDDDENGDDPGTGA